MNVAAVARLLVFCVIAYFAQHVSAHAGQTGSDPSRYDVVWKSPSKDYSGSMPLGNGDISLNAWMEESGDLLMYVGKTDSWDENGRLLKVGRIRIHLSSGSAGIAEDFLQTLDLQAGGMRLRFGKGRQEVSVRLWVDACHPAVIVEIESAQPESAVASIELWRTQRDTLQAAEVSDTYCDYNNTYRGTTYLEPDQVLSGRKDRIGWFHHNRTSTGPAISSRIQGLDGFPRPDPLIDRTFGAVITAASPAYIDSLHLGSVAGRHHVFNVYVETRHPSTVEAWSRAMDSAVAGGRAIPLALRRRAHAAWWKKFWERSWIHVERAGGTSPAVPDDAFLVSQAYALQRFVSACAGRGRYPIKFNGSTLTVPAEGKQGDADYRRWGPGYWWQNTRLPYISMCASGDEEFMLPLFRMYGKELLPLFRYRTQLYLHHHGAYIPECIYFWGDVFNETYGWTPYEIRTDKLQESRWHKWEWVSGLELVHLMLEYYTYTGDPGFARAMLLPAAQEVLIFFNEHYQVDVAGRFVMHPSQALETWWDCTNPLPEIAGLHAVIAQLLQLPGGLASPSMQAFWRALREKLPDLPTRIVDGDTMLAPATQFADKHNIENPELYAVFPFRLVSLEKANRNLGISALLHRPDRGSAGWRQDDIFMAYLGLADSARAYIVQRAAHYDPGSRFPAFWGPNYDWVPDQDHGSVLMKALQAMLLQTDGRNIFLLPAWPGGWDAEFRLHAPGKTTITGAVRGGKLARLDVSPASRRADIRILPAGGADHHNR